MSDLLTPEQRASIAAQLGAAKPAASTLLVSLAESVEDRREHEHPEREDWYCLNIVGYMGERMAPVLRRLLDAEAQLGQLRARVAELEAARGGERRTGYQRAINVMRQERLPMSVGLLEAQFELDALDAAEDQPAPTPAEDDDSHEAAVARYLSTPYTGDFPRDLRPGADAARRMLRGKDRLNANTAANAEATHWKRIGMSPPSPGELAEQRHLVDPLDHVLEHLADEHPAQTGGGAA